MMAITKWSFQMRLGTVAPLAPFDASTFPAVTASFQPILAVWRRMPPPDLIEIIEFLGVLAVLPTGLPTVGRAF